jgi:predicted AAA+ superfamily ATPase
MKRSAYNQLLQWKESASRKPLILQGARQVGKTFLVNDFGKNEYTNFVYLNFEQNESLQTFFDQSLYPERIIADLGLFLGKKITAKDTLLFFDEIQVAPKVLTSLKYFQEQAPDYHIIAAGSLLGVSMGKKSSFPVGKVNFLTMQPMSFSEYLLAMGENLMVEMLGEISTVQPLSELIHEKLLQHLKMYLFLGGMPEVVQNYIDNRDIVQVRVIQNEILEAYKRDFSKYDEPNQEVRTSEFWNSIPGQLAKENKKFKYADIRHGARSAMFEQTVEWLRGAGLINVVYNLTTPKKPLSAYADYTKFKVYLHDVGLLAAKLNVPSELIVTPSELFSEFNGAFIENFVAQELVYYNLQSKQYYWTSRGEAEVDFIVETDNNIYPVEIKSGTSRNLKSLRSYSIKYNPGNIFRISPRNLIQSDDFINIPLYAVNVLFKLAK